MDTIRGLFGANKQSNDQEEMLRRFQEQERLIEAEARHQLFISQVTEICFSQCVSPSGAAIPLAADEEKCLRACTGRFMHMMKNLSSITPEMQDST